MNQLKANKQVVAQYVEAFNRGGFDALRKIYAPNAGVQGVLGQRGMDKVIAIWREIISAFAIQFTVEEIIAEGDCVAVRYTERGKFVGPFRGQQPTGKSYELVALEWFVVKDGKIYQRWGARDAASQARQIGLTLS